MPTAIHFNPVIAIFLDIAFEGSGRSYRPIRWSFDGLSELPRLAEFHFRFGILVATSVMGRIVPEGRPFLDALRIELREFVW